MIKAIETVYNGYRFRSRLEARWAVFFDTLGIEYRYEQEGFDLGKVGWYLPDFWLPRYDIWIEIKPFLSSDEAIKKCYALAEGLHNHSLLICGTPWPGDYSCFLFNSYSTLDQCEKCGRLMKDVFDLVVCPDCGEKWSYRDYPYDYEIYSWDQVVFDRVNVPLPNFGLICLRHIEYLDEIKRRMEAMEFNPELAGIVFLLPLALPPRLSLAFTMARQARFEHRDNAANRGIA